MNPALSHLAPLLGAVEIHNRTGPNAPCQAQNKAFCFGWAADNFDRYTTPFLNQLLLVMLCVALGFAIAFGLALITGLGWTTAILILTVYTLQILFRNILAGLANVPPESKDAGRGMGMTDRQLLWRVELPLALPEIIAGLRIATVSTVAISTLMVFANVDTLGGPLYQQITFKTNIVIAGGLSILMAITFDALLLGAQRLLAPWRRPSKEAIV